MADSSSQFEESGSLAFLGRSAVLNVLFATEAVASFLLDVVIAAAFGLGVRSDALYAAYALPQKVGRGMFQSLTNSFMGLFAGEMDRQQAYREAITVIAVLAAPLSAILSLTATWWLPVTIPGASPETRLAAVPLAAVLAWLLAFLALAETFRAVYYHEGVQWLPTLTRVAGAALSIVVVLVSPPEQRLTLAAWGLTLGAALEAIVGLALMRPVLKVRYVPAWPSAARLRTTLAMVGVPLAGQGVHVVASLGEQALASLLPPGSITAANYARRIINTLERFVFRGFLITTIRRSAGRQRTDVRSDFRQIMLVAIPVAVIMVALPVPLTAVIFGRGQFGSGDVLTLALALQMFAPAVLGEAATRIPSGLAYAERRLRLLFTSAVLSSATLLISEAVLIWAGLGLRALGLSSALASAMSFAWLYATLLRPGRVRVADRRGGFQLAMAGAGAWLGTVALQALVRAAMGAHAPNLVLLAGGTLGCGVFLVATAYMLGLHEVRRLVGVLRGGVR
ncbi:MAG: lipid II flippase MurJ [Anaerolineae bacterium]|jgi:putative peptidoglycan lipid II flippase|nr:lipid II flippase MurJ [Anaerolineae bacterium]